MPIDSKTIKATGALGQQGATGRLSGLLQDAVWQLSKFIFHAGWVLNGALIPVPGAGGRR